MGLLVSPLREVMGFVLQSSSASCETEDILLIWS